MALTSDIQRALQNAIGEANNAFSQATAIPLKKKNKKRARDVLDDGETEVEVDAGRQVTKEKRREKKKSKKNAVEEEGQQQPQEETMQTTVTEPTKKKKKSKKKDKGKQPAENNADLPSHPVYAPFDLQGASAPNHPASSDAFLSALVTAASEGTNPSGEAPGLGSSQAHPQYTHAPHATQYMPYPQPPMPYSYFSPQYSGQSSTSSQAPPTSQQQPHPSLFSLPMGVPLNDLALGSNEDILRNMQELDLDMGKIANVLRTLSEAAAAANANNAKQSQQQHQGGFLGGQALSTTDIAPPPALNQVPTTAGDILTSASTGEPKQTKPIRNRVDMSLPAPAEQNVNSADHTYLLANKWMNAGKLAEMVKSQGEYLLLLESDYMVS